MQATKLLALTLAIILSPRLAMTDVVGQLGHSGARAVASTPQTVESRRAGDQKVTKVASTKPAGPESGFAWKRSSTPKIKGRWGSLRRVPLLRRPRSKALRKLLCQPADGLVVWLSTSSCSNWSGVSGLANR